MISSTAELFDGGIEIDAETLRALRDDGVEMQLLDVREDWERALCALPGTIDIPMAMLPDAIGRLPSGISVVVICHHGGRSLQVAKWLRQQGNPRVVSLKGGIDNWARTIDPSLPIY